MLTVKSKFFEKSSLVALSNNFHAVVAKAMSEVGEQGKKFMQQYPGPPARRKFRPPVVAMWVRGVGWVYLRTKKIENISEKLGTKWESSFSNKILRLSNTASYAKYVQSFTQQWIEHKETGWNTEVQLFEYLVDKRIAYKAFIGAIKDTVR